MTGNGKHTSKHGDDWWMLQMLPCFTRMIPNISGHSWNRGETLWASVVWHGHNERLKYMSCAVKPRCLLGLLEQENTPGISHMAGWKIFPLWIPWIQGIETISTFEPYESITGKSWTESIYSFLKLVHVHDSVDSS